MALKDKAKKSSSTGTLAKKAQSTGFSQVEKTPEALVAERASLPAVTNQPPTPPPPLIYLRYFAEIPSLRLKTNVGN